MYVVECTTSISLYILQVSKIAEDSFKREYVVAKISVDTAENEPLKVWAAAGKYSRIPKTKPIYTPAFLVRGLELADVEPVVRRVLPGIGKL